MPSTVRRGKQRLPCPKQDHYLSQSQHIGQLCNTHSPTYAMHHSQMAVVKGCRWGTSRIRPDSDLSSWDADVGYRAVLTGNTHW